MCDLPARRGLRSYSIGNSGQSLIFGKVVLRHFERHRQTHLWHREAGGQLFARLDATHIMIEKATGPRRTDHRTRNSYIPNRRAEQAEICEQHSAGLHYVGDWHTHPELDPRPSQQDLASMGNCFMKSKHALNGFVLVIVGNGTPLRLHVSLHDGLGSYELLPNP